MATRATDDGTIRDDDPVAGDWGLVVRPFGGTAPSPRGTTAVLSTVLFSNLSVVIRAANAASPGFSVKNTSTSSLWLSLSGPAAVNGPASVELVPGAYYESPFNFQGQCQGIWDTAVDGAALVTDFVFV